jgi:hypothetical protein
MRVSPKVNFEELARSTDEFNGAQLKVRLISSSRLPAPADWPVSVLFVRQAVCVEAGMIALREGSKQIGHEHYLSGVLEVQAKKKNEQVSLWRSESGFRKSVTDLLLPSTVLLCVIGLGRSLSFALQLLHRVCVVLLLAPLVGRSLSFAAKRGRGTRSKVCFRRLLDLIVPCASFASFVRL